MCALIRFFLIADHSGCVWVDLCERHCGSDARQPSPAMLLREDFDELHRMFACKRSIVFTVEPVIDISDSMLIMLGLQCQRLCRLRSVPRPVACKCPSWRNSSRFATSASSSASIIASIIVIIINILRYSTLVGFEAVSSVTSILKSFR